MQASPRFLLPALVLALACPQAVSAQTALVKENPFGQSSGGQAAVAEASESVEFSGIFVGNKTLVILYDKVAKKSRMIPVGETMDGIQVISYDAPREQVSVKVGGDQKLLTLRKSTGGATGAPRGAPAPNPAMNFNVQTAAPIEVAKVPPAPPPIATPDLAPPAAATPPAANPAKPEEPGKPLSIARQEEEARMLVSDLLEIGMAQRKAYEEKQRQAASAEQSAAATPPPTATQPARQPD